MINDNYKPINKDNLEGIVTKLKEVLNPNQWTYSDEISRLYFKLSTDLDALTDVAVLINGKTDSDKVIIFNGYIAQENLTGINTGSSKIKCLGYYFENQLLQILIGIENPDSPEETDSVKKLLAEVFVVSDTKNHCTQISALDSFPVVTEYTTTFTGESNTSWEFQMVGNLSTDSPSISSRTITINPSFTAIIDKIQSAETADKLANNITFNVSGTGIESTSSVLDFNNDPDNVNLTVNVDTQELENYIDVAIAGKDIPAATTSVLGGFKQYGGVGCPQKSENQCVVKMDHTSGYHYAYVDLNDISATLDQDIHRYTNMDDATVDHPNLGEIVQYIGNTTASYTHGYFYMRVRELIQGQLAANTNWQLTNPATGLATLNAAITEYNKLSDHLLVMGQALTLTPVDSTITSNTIDDNTVFNVVNGNFTDTLTYADIKEWGISLSTLVYDNQHPELFVATITLSYINESNPPVWILKNVLPPINVPAALVYKGVCTWAELETKTLISNPGDFYTVSDKTNLEYFFNGIITSNWEDSWEYMGQVFTQYQADWAQNNSSAADYIKNKPNLATVATSGSYTDLSNTPTIPAAQVNSDWNSTSGVSEILNKPNLATVATSGAYADLSGTPTLATVATSGSYNDLSNTPSIPAAQIQSDWNQTDNTLLDFIKNKPTIPTVPTNVSAFTNDAGYITSATNSASLQVSDVSNRKINTSETTGNYLQFTGGTDKFTITDKDNQSFDVSISHTDPTVNNGTYSVKTKVGTTETTVSDFTANQSGADDVTFILGSNVTLTPDDTNRTITITATDTTYSTFGASGSSHSSGLVPDPGATSGTSKYLCEDGTWSTPAGSGGTDEKVKQTVGSLNNTYPLLASAQSSPTSGTAYEAIYDDTIKVNPSKHSLSLGASTEATGSSSHAEGNAGYWYEGTGLMVTGVSGGAFVLNGDPTNIISVGDWVRYKSMEGNVIAVTSSSATISTTVHMEGPAELELRTMRHNIASGEASHAEGLFTTASGKASHAEGCNTTTSSSYSHAEGYGTKTVGSSAHAEGENTVAAGIRSHSAGVGRELSKGTVTLNGTIITFTTAPKLRIGNILRLSDQYRCVIACTSDTEYEVNVAFSSSLSGETIYLVEGVAYGDDSTSFGLYCTATSRDSFAEGYRSIAHGEDSHAEGRFTYTCAEAAHAECNNTIAGKDSSHAEGWVTATLETGAHAEGGGTLALGSGSHAEGRVNIASGKASHAEGGPEGVYKLNMEATNIAFNFRTLTFTTSVSVPSYATFVVVKYGDGDWDESYYAIESISSSGTTCTVVIKDIYCGFKQTSALSIFLYVANNIALGNSSHAEGVNTLARGIASHSGGIGTIADLDYMTVIGKYNTIGDTSALFVVGNGTSGQASNAFKVTNDGKAAVRDSITAGSFIKSGGTSSQFLKADGSVDSNTYSTTSHTHSLSLATDSGTSSISLAANTKYKLTAGGSTYIFTTPADSDTTYTFAEGLTDGAFSVTSGGSTSSVAVHNVLKTTGGTMTGQVYHTINNPSISSNAVTITCDKKYNWITLLGGTLTLNISMPGNLAGPCEVICAVKNTDSSNAMTLTLPSSSNTVHNMIGLSAFTIEKGKIAEIVFTFWSTTDVSFNGGVEE